MDEHQPPVGRPQDRVGRGREPAPPGQGREPPPPRTVRIRCRTDGPLVVELSPDLEALGVSLRVDGPDGAQLHPPATDRPMALCRCGSSASKPWCDGNHRLTGLRDGPASSGRPDAP